MVWRQRHTAAAQQHLSSPRALQPSLLQLNVPRLSDWKFRVLPTYNVHESLGV